MTIKEMFRKIETYNDIAKLVGTDQIKITITVDTFYIESFQYFADFRKWLKKEWISEMGEAFLKYADFEFNAEHLIEYEDIFGDELLNHVEIDTYSA